MKDFPIYIIEFVIICTRVLFLNFVKQKLRFLERIWIYITVRDKIRYLVTKINMPRKCTALKNSSIHVREILFDSVRSVGQVFWQWASTISEREIRGSREGRTKERVDETWWERHWRRMENLSSRTEPSLLGPFLKRLKEGLQDSASRTLVRSYDGRCWRAS